MTHCEASNFHIREFSRRADEYQKYSFLQQQIAKHLISKSPKISRRILDLGCGSGVVIKEIKNDFNLFVGVDFAKNMCELHPKSEKIEIINANFDDGELFKNLQNYTFDTIFSSSALQWSKNLQLAAYNISKISKNFYASIFTSNTFKSIYQTSKLKEFLPTTNFVIESFDNYFDLKYEIKTYKIEFTDTLSIFKYIKNSGVSGGVRRLGFKETKELIKSYPYSYLEFEVIYLWAYLD